MMPHAYTFELVQFGGALIGVILNTYGLVQAVKDATALTSAGLNGTRKLVAAGNVQQEFIRLVVQVLLAISGLIAVILPPPNPDLPEMFLWMGRVQRGVLLSITFLLALKSMLDVHARRVLTNLWMEEQDRRRSSQAIDFPDRRRGPDRRRPSS